MSASTGLDVRLVVRHDSEFVLDAGFVVPAGSTTALLGPNGAGKSTALAAIAGLVPLDDGHVRLAGRTLADVSSGLDLPPARRGLGIVFQDGRLFAHLDVLDNVAFGPRSAGASREASRTVARGWLERLGISDLARRRPAQLSGGQVQRVAMCRALAAGPAALLLDEPMAALDVAGRASLRRTLADHLAELSMPRLLVTHDPVEAFLLADHVVVLEAGRVTQDGTPDEIRLHPTTPFAADLAGANLLTGIARAGAVDLGDAVLQVADRAVDGPVTAVVHARAVVLSAERPVGSARNAWQLRVERVEDLGGRVRVALGGPVTLAAEVTPAAVAELGLTRGQGVWASVKATEITVLPSG